MNRFLLCVFIVALLTPNVGATSTLISGVVNFDSETNLSTLLSSVGNVSQLSESGGIYTMHVPFYQNNSSVQFSIADTTMHMKAENSASMTYLWYANLSITNSTVLGWNISASAPAPSTDTYRPYFIGVVNSKVVITGSNFSYLGYGDSLGVIDTVPCGSDMQWVIPGALFACDETGIATMDGNDFSYLDGGFSVGDNSTFTDNTFSYNKNAEIITDSDAYINNNTFIDSAGEAILITNSDNTTVTNNTMDGDNADSGASYGIICSDCTNSLMAYNTISQYDIGLWLTESSITSTLNTVHGNVIHDNHDYGLQVSYDSSSEFYNNQYYNNKYGIYTEGSTSETFTNETVYDNVRDGVYAHSGSSLTFDSCVVDDKTGIYFDYKNIGSTSMVILDNTNRSNTIYSGKTFDIKYTSGTEYNTTHTIGASCALVDNPLTGVLYLNTTVVSGSMSPALADVSYLDSYVLAYSNGTGIQIKTSTALGVLTFDESVSSGDYIVVLGDDGFIFSGASVTPSSITTAEASVIAVTVVDSDGTIETVYANVGGVNYSASAYADNEWKYPYSSATTGTYAVTFYARDNHGYWNSTDPSLTVTVTAVSTPPPGGTPPPPDICEGVVCSNYCDAGTLYYQGTCGLDGLCAFVTQENHPDCVSDLCDGVVCADHCEGTTFHFNGSCTDGTCTFDTAENHPNCPATVVDVWGMVVNLFFLLLALILMIVVYNEVLSK